MAGYYIAAINWGELYRMHSHEIEAWRSWLSLGGWCSVLESNCSWKAFGRESMTDFCSDHELKRIRLRFKHFRMRPRWGSYGAPCYEKWLGWIRVWYLYVLELWNIVALPHWAEKGYICWLWDNRAFLRTLFPTLHNDPRHRYLWPMAALSS